MLNKIREQLEALKGLFQILVDIWKTIKRYPAFFLGVGGLSCIAAALYYLAFHYPSHVIIAFYQDLNGKHYQDAWERLDVGYRERLWKTQPNFGDMYNSCLSHRVLSVEDTLRPSQFFQALFADSMVFKVKYDAEDRFTAEILRDGKHADNLRWVQQRYRLETVDYFLTNGTTKDGQPSLDLPRGFETEVTVTKSALGWRITKLKRDAVTLYYNR